MINRILCLNIVLALISCTSNQQQIPIHQTAITEARIIIDSLMKEQKIPGMDVAVYLQDSIVWSEGFGYADLEHMVPVKTGETRFRIASISKPLTAAAIGRLVDQGKLDLDADIREYVPYFPRKRYPVTVREVGGHIGGIRHYRGNEIFSAENYPDVASGIEIFMHDPLVSKPGTRYHYSSYGFNLLSAAVEGAGDNSFLDFMTAEVFDPLQMHSTIADINDSIIPDRTAFYQRPGPGSLRNAPHVDISYKWGGGGFLSTTHDLVKFGMAHLQPGYLSAETLTQFHTPQALENGENSDYGIGWHISKDSMGRRQVFHSGGIFGGTSRLIIYPEEKLILVMLSNFSNTRFNNVPAQVIELFLEELRQ